ncbi:MAG: hypothetical protein L0G74_11880 [Staphylococcus equorum]|nr:hypothetical protein [Staphylococcus equorum]
MKNTPVDNMITMRYILENLKENNGDIESTILALNAIDLEVHHKDDLKVKNEKELVLKYSYLLEHLSQVRLDRFRKEFKEEMRCLDELFKEYFEEE